MASDVAERFGRNLFMCRRRAGFSQEALGRAAGLHRTELGLLEHGRRVPRIDTLVKLACSLTVPTDDLLDGIVWEGPGSSQTGQFSIGGR